MSFPPSDSSWYANVIAAAILIICGIVTALKEGEVLKARSWIIVIVCGALVTPIISAYLESIERDKQDEQILKILTEIRDRGDYPHDAYIIRIETDVGPKDLGTDADVFVILHGQRGDTDEMQLDDETINDFEEGQINSFAIKTRLLGELNGITIRRTKEDGDAGWGIKSISIIDQKDDEAFVGTGVYLGGSAGLQKRVEVSKVFKAQ